MRPQPRHYWPKSRSGEGTCRTVLGDPPVRRRAGPTRIRRTSTEFPSTALGEAEKPARSEAEGWLKPFPGVLVTSRSGAPRCARSRVITGQSQGQEKGLAGKP